MIVFGCFLLCGSVALALAGGEPEVPSSLGPSGIGAKPCCGECAIAQRNGEMKWGTTCGTCTTPTRRIHAIAHCEPFIYSEISVDQVAAAAQDEGLTDPAAITLRVLERLWPIASTDERIDWGRVGPGWDPCLRLLKARVWARVYFLRGYEQLAAAEAAWRDYGLLETEVA